MTAASSGPRSRPVSARRSAFKSPPTAFNSRTTVRGSTPASTLEHELRVGAGLREIPRSAEHRGQRNRHADPSGELLVAHRGKRLGREAPQSCEVEMDVVARQFELLEVRAHGFCRVTRVPKRGDAPALRALRQLAPVGAEDQPVVHELRWGRSKRFEEPPVHRFVGAMVVAADDVRDPEVDVVDNGRELVRRRAVLAQPIPSHSRSARIAASPPSTFRAGSVSSMRRSIQSPRRRLMTALSALPRCSDPVGLGAKRTLAIGRVYE